MKKRKVTQVQLTVTVGGMEHSLEISPNEGVDKLLTNEQIVIDLTNTLLKLVLNLMKKG